MSETIYITGIGGMIGSYLYWYLKNIDRDFNLIGSYYNPSVKIEKEMSENPSISECDIRYFNSVYSIIEKFRPSKIFHLAAQSVPSVSWSKPKETFDINVNGTINIYESIKLIRKTDPHYDPVVIVACSSAEYGNSMINTKKPITEDSQLLPLSPYAVSKVSQDLLSYQYYLNENIKTIRARIFNTTGPRKINDVLSDFTKRAVLLKKHDNKIISVGNITNERAIMDVRDLIRALFLLSDKGKLGECYNVCGTHIYKISSLLGIIEEIMGFKMTAVQKPSLLRPSDEASISGNTDKLFSDTGWEQEIPIQQTITDMIKYWEKVIE